MNFFYNYKKNIPKIVWIIIGFSTLVRILVAHSVEFGNDEVYYWLYALYPDISHFDHPPMVGFFIQCFTFNLYFDSEVFIRLVAIIPASFNMFLLYKIGKYLNDEFSGLINVLLYNISIYGLVISGIFILPDAPLLTFWLLSFFFFLKTLPLSPKKSNKKELFLAFLFAGFAIYSKYQGIYLLIGAVSYILFYNRAWLKEKLLYLFSLIPLIFIFIILYWNYRHNFSSFSFHSNRISLFSFTFNKDSFFREVVGEMLYNNPYLIFLLFTMLIDYFNKKWSIEKPIFRLFSTFTFPLIFTVIYLSLYKDTLPHWTGVSYITILPLIGLYVSKKKKYIKAILGIFVLMFILLFFTVNIVNNGWFIPKDTHTTFSLGRKDFTLDMYGWKQAGQKVGKFFKENDALKKLNIVSNKWFPAAHIDYYIAKPLEKGVYGLGPINDIHKYYWINKRKPALTTRVIYITDSKNYKNPNTVFASYFAKNKLLKKIPITRAGIIVKYIFIYELFNTV